MKSMHPIQKYLITLLLMTVGSAGADRKAAGTFALKEWSLPDLEQQLTDIDTELDQLANYTLRGGTGSPGYRSRGHKEPDALEWVRIELGEESTIDQVVLVPTLMRDSKMGLRAEGFPRALRILAGTEGTTTVVASVAEEDNLLPRITPLTVEFPPTKASWVRIEATTLSPMVRGDRHVLQLSEIMVFSGMENVALQKKVQVQHPYKKIESPRAERFLTDGFTPYLMDAAQGPLSQTQLMNVKNTRSPPTLTIDLQAPRPINQINLHTASTALSIPMVNLESWAVPRHVRVEGAKRANFSDATFLFEYRQDSAYDNGPIIMQRFPETQCRYIRITILDHTPVVSLEANPKRIAFSEIEVLSESRNVALETTVVASSNLSYSKDALPRLTDGLNYYGKILPTKDWMNQLARRHDLETKRPLVVAELNTRHEHQKTNLHRMSWLAALLAAGIGFTLLIDRMLRQRTVFRTRERIAANLHDELGANLHAIALLGDLAKQEVSDAAAEEKWATLIHYINETRTLTEQTVKTTRYCTHMLEAHELHENLVEEIKKTGERLLADLEHDLSFTHTDRLQRLQPRRRIGLYLFYKECLTNIIRHAKATRVETRLTADKKRIYLTVTDNGQGQQEAPSSLKRRARLLNAKLSVETPTEGGSKITLTLRPRRGLRPRQKSKVRKSTVPDL